MPLIDLTTEKIEPTIEEVLQNRVTLLELHRQELNALLSEAKFPETLYEIRFGHKRRQADLPSIEVNPLEGQWPWLATSVRDLNYMADVLVMIKNIESNVKYKYLAVLESGVRTVLNHPRNLQFKVRNYQIYDSQCQSTGYGTLDQGAVYACRLSWLGKLWKPYSSFNIGETYGLGGFSG